ncbi:MAG: VC0807 family protein [Opitutaceae bacterium]
MSLPPPKRENLLLNLVCNIALPTFVLTKLSTENRLGPLWGLLVALAFPVTYGLYDLVRRRKTNFLSILGFVSVLLSGSLTLLKVGGIWFAVKDAVLPTLIGLTVLASLRSKNSLVREVFFNEQVIDVPRVNAALEARGQQQAFNALLRRAGVGLALTFIATAPVLFFLARHVLRSPAGTPEFNAELGRMHWLAPLITGVPCMAVLMLMLWRLIAGMRELTGLTTDELFHAEPDKKSADAKP